MESEGDSPKKTDENKKALEYRSNLTRNKEPNIKRTSIVHRPIYMQQSTQKSITFLATNVMEQSIADDITSKSVYDMPDALEEPRKKPISTTKRKRTKQKEKKPARKHCKKERPGKIIPNRN